MTYSIDVEVLSLEPDFDPMTGNAFTKVIFGYREAVPAPPQLPPTIVGVQVPKPIHYKHTLHIFIPKEKWVDQFRQWTRYHMIVTDDGTVTLKRAE